MQADCSLATGICIFEAEDGCEPLVIQVDTPPSPIRHPLPPWFALISDWQIIRGDSRDAILDRARTSFWNHRCGSYLETCLSGIPDDLLQDLIEEVELALQTHAEPRGVTRHLLRAPLTHPDRLRKICDAALASGCGATAAVVTDVLEYQPHLHRFVSAWLQVADASLSPWQIEPQSIYLRLTQHPDFLNLLDATSPQFFAGVFFDFAREQPDPAYRQACFVVSRELATAILGESVTHEPSLAEIARMDAESDIPESSGPPTPPDPHSAYVSSLRQVGAIVEAVAEGHDARAKLFLRDLIDSQTAFPGAQRYAVKSLCNIAKRCADVFRVDFEARCLRAALKIDPTDSWTLIQLADHLKRTGSYNDALAAADQALAAGGGVVALSCRADVLAQRGDLRAAMAAYMNIDGFESLPEVRTAMADLLRRSGDLDAAESSYTKLIREGLYSDRVDAGLAEIAKRRGDLSKAQSLYEALLQGSQLRERERTVYRIALAGILKQQGKYLEAYDIVQALVTDLPFFMPAKIVRGSIMGLLDREAEGLADIPSAGRPRAFGEWRRNYTRGLLLLRMCDFSQARTQLLDNLRTAVIAEEERDVTRLASALFFIMNDDSFGAAQFLTDDLIIRDKYADYALSVLRLHVAVALQDTAQARHILDSIEQRSFDDKLLGRAVVLIQGGKLKEAERVEIDALLRLAA